MARLEITYRQRVAMAKRYAKLGQRSGRLLKPMSGQFVKSSLIPGNSEDWLIAIEMVKIIREIDNEL